MSGSTCCGGLGTCGLASSVTGPAASSYSHDTCKASAGADDLKCIPTTASLADAGTAGIFDACTADFGGGVTLEGRCLPLCFIEGNPQAPLLTPGTCKGADAGAGQQVCAPCYNPIDGSDTGACSQKPGDQPKDAPPTPFKTCGAHDAGVPGGVCIPKALTSKVDNPAIASLMQDDCPSGDLCVPTVKANDVNACFAKCDVMSPTVAMFGQKYTVGACVPYYIVADTQPTALSALVQSSCAAGELCAPCLNPLMSGMPTGACQ